VQAVGAYDATNTLMPGSAGMYADPSSAEINICPFPGNPDKYYIIYNDQTCSPLYYSIVDMTLNGGLGDVVALNTQISSDNFSEGLEIVRVPCADYLWLLSYNCDEGIVRWRVDDSGISDPTLLQAYNDPQTQGFDGRGELDFHKGHIGLGFTYCDLTAWADFDPVTGDLSNFNVVPIPIINGNGMYGIEFSPNGEYGFTSQWYTTGGENNLYVVELATMSVIGQYNIQPNAGGGWTSAGEIELGPDGNLYMVMDGTNAIKVIHDADTGTPTFTEIVTTSQLALGMDDPIQSDLSGIVISGTLPEEDPIIPNVFTPNSDDENENFTVGGIDLDVVSDFRLRVYDRWGLEVANTTNVRNGWNGRLNGSLADEGVYYYIMDLAYETHGCNGELLARKQLETQKGWVQLLR
jgi:gliding motility-associated-like protein